MDKKILMIAGVFVVVVFVLFKVVSRGPSPSSEATFANPSAQELYKKAMQLRKDHNLLEAKKIYQELLINYPEIDNIASIEKELEDINMRILFSTVPVEGKTVMHDVESGDSLAKLAKKYGTTIEFIKRCNGLQSDIIRIGQKLRVWTGAFNVLVDKSQNLLTLMDDSGVIKVYTISTGENNSTPVGEFKIVSKLKNPVWFNRGVVVPPESPQNVLGTRWLGFDLPGYGIHGTVEPETIGQQVTAGCVRMRNEEVEELYTILPMGTKVVVQD